MIHHKLKLQTLLFFLLFLSVIGSYLIVEDSAYMLELLEAITPTPPGWSNNTNICSWKDVGCLTDGVFITSINLDSKSLSGILPSGLNSLSYLSYLSLANNSFTGPLPSLANLNSLTYVDLSHNNFTSIPPDCFQGLPSLQQLSLRNNVNLEPWTFPNLTHSSQLLSLDLDATNIMGSLPDIFHSFPNLDVLQVGSNQLNGVVPPSLMNLFRLETVSLEGNLLQGPVPVFGKGVNVTLGSNRFCRAHPGPCDQRVTTLLEIAASFEYPLHLAESWVGNDPCHDWFSIVCTTEGKIRTVNLTNQNLTGTISPAFANLTDLRNLYLDGNSLTGPIPDNLTSLPQLEVLDVSTNNLSGVIPKFSPKVRVTTTGNVLLRPYPDSARRNKTSMSTVWIAGIFGVAGVIVILIVIVYNHKRCLNLVQKIMFKKTRTLIDHSIEDFIRSYGSLTPKRYSFSEIKRITNSFHDKLGQGGYGVVYKASLTDGCLVAVKVLNDSKGSGEEFINEVASISRTSHVNIVSLLGFCYEVNKRALIYEYMPHGSLDKFIYKNGSTNAICNLNWNTLYQIAIGIARGLEYLHRGCSTRILHLDIKPQNILLDEDFCPKISDFGLAKICQKKESVVSLLGTRGTIGYIAPEVFSRTYGGVSHKSDVYSYGMLILEMVGGKKNYNSVGSHTSEMYFPDWIYKDIEQDNFGRCLANTVEENDIVMKITLVSLWCIQPNPLERPSMSKVLEMLEGPLQSVPYPPKPILYSPEMSSLSFSDVSYSNIHETN